MRCRIKDLNYQDCCSPPASPTPTEQSKSLLSPLTSRLTIAPLLLRAYKD